MNNDFVAMTGHVKNGNYNFVFLNDNTACEIDKNGYIKRVGVHKISYSQNEIINKISSSFNTNDLEKGYCIEFDNFFKITFDYKSLESQNKIVENVINIKIPKNILDDDNCYTNFHRLTTMCNQLHRIKLINQARIEAAKKKAKIEKKNTFIFILLAAGAIIASSAMVANGIVESAKAEQERQLRMIDEINESRKEHGIPPLGYLDEDGKQSNSWDDYYRGVKKRQEEQNKESEEEQNKESVEEEIEELDLDSGPVL